ncbi:MAG: prephenate dehydrogenase/arogenate dehydrogenase family protein [Rickettsiales bacterium]
MTTHIFKQMTVIGLGLIGSSVARAVRDNRLAEKIVGYDHNEISIAFALKEKFIDSGDMDLPSAVFGSDLVIIATPPATLGEIAQEIAPHLIVGAIVMDVASVKRPAVEAIAPHLPETVIFIPAHPIAGSEQSGVRAGRADLFRKKRLIITPKEPPQAETLDKITAFWAGMGARLEGMPAEIHDMIYGYMSHLSQLIAFCLEQPLGRFFEMTEGKPVYKSFLRLAGSSPELWAEIFEQNKDNLLSGLDRYIDVVTHVHKELLDAPETQESGNDEVLAYTVLFPRIVASCLITTVMEAEKNAGIPFARYAGTGFADMSAPAILPPEEDMEHISAQYKLVANILDQFLLRLKLFRTSIG